MDIYECPVCLVALKAGDECATDIELGTCHAACLDGSPVVNLESGEPSDGPIHTYLFRHVMAPALTAIPTPSPEEDLVAAREAVIRAIAASPAYTMIAPIIAEIRLGRHDKGEAVQSALLAIRSERTRRQ